MVDFNSMYKATLEANEAANRKPEIRSSGMPFCPRQFVFQYMDFYDEKGTWGYLGDFYCGIGNSVHSSVQKWTPIANPGYFLGNWKCKKCKVIILFKVGPLNCPCCGRLMTYKELVVDFIDAPVGGHCDGLLLEKKTVKRLCKKFCGKVNVKNINKLLGLNKNLKIPAWVLEIKTTSIWNVRSITDPYTSHKCQAEIYTSSLRRVIPIRYNNKNIDVKGYIIKYISRDNPRATSRDFKKEVVSDILYKNTCRMVNLLMSAVKTLKIKKIYNLRPCDKWPNLYEDCDLDSVCEEISKKEFLRIVKKIRRSLGTHVHWKKLRLFSDS